MNCPKCNVNLSVWKSHKICRDCQTPLKMKIKFGKMILIMIPLVIVSGVVKATVDITLGRIIGYVAIGLSIYASIYFVEKTPN